MGPFLEIFGELIIPKTLSLSLYIYLYKGVFKYIICITFMYYDIYIKYPKPWAMYGDG